MPALPSPFPTPVSASLRPPQERSREQRYSQDRTFQGPVSMLKSKSDTECRNQISRVQYHKQPRNEPKNLPEAGQEARAQRSQNQMRPPRRPKCRRPS
eukprot:2700067-Pleurochrysis_carterae.AAC.1